MNATIKHIYLAVGTSLMLSSCGQEDISAPKTNVENERIIFRTSLPGVISRATEIANNLSYLHVTAFNPADKDLIKDNGDWEEYFKNVKIEQKNGSFISDKCVWPAPGKDGDMTFFAYYPTLNDDKQLVNASKVNDGATTIDYKIKDFRVAANIAEQVDFVTAYASGSMAKNIFSGIKLDFAHQLSRIEIEAWGDNKNYDIEIAGVRIGGVGVQQTFDFKPIEGGGVWADDLVKGSVEYIYRNGDKIVSLDKKEGSPITSSNAASIMGKDLGDKLSNCAMVLPTIDDKGWDKTNNKDNMYISVLLRVTDAAGTRQYPYPDNTQGENVQNIPVEYFAVDKATGKAVSRRLYKNDDNYFTDKEYKDQYSLPENEIVKEFGWAALPITGNWQPGNIYTYTLDYSYGIGLHDPDVEIAGDPIISDKVGVAVSVKEWKSNPATGVEVPES